MKKLTVLTISILALLALAAGPSLAAGTPQELMAQAQALYQQRADLAKAKQAAALFSQVLAADPKNEQAAVSLAQTCYWIGNHEQGDEAKMATFQRGIDAGKQALAINPNSLGGHFWLGVNYSVFGRTKGIMESLSLINPIKDEMAAVIKLDPAYQGGGAYRVLGRVYFKVPGIFGGSNSQSIENLQKAIKYGPRRWLSHIYLAETYLDEGEKDKARALLEQVVAGPPEPGMEPEYAEEKAWAQRLLKEMQ